LMSVRPSTIWPAPSGNLCSRSHGPGHLGDCPTSAGRHNRRSGAAIPRHSQTTCCRAPRRSGSQQAAPSGNGSRRTVSGDASIALFGNTNRPIEVMVQSGHLFEPMPDAIPRHGVHRSIALLPPRVGGAEDANGTLHRWRMGIPGSSWKVECSISK
jgi:hypothetical protein